MSTTDTKIKAIIGSDYPKIVIPEISSATSKIKIMMYEWKWYTHEKAGGVEQFNLAILNKARNRVDINVLLNIETMSHPLTKINSRSATFLQKAGIKVKFGQVGVSTHAKMIIIDDRKCIIGSHNISKGSFTRNQECSVLIEGGEAIRPFIDYFHNLWMRF